ncbi:MAG: transcriptional repressor [Verrucomicrobia bacterium]|nr:transcriptional repressor [Verrucomicrobiota bacterium]
MPQRHRLHDQLAAHPDDPSGPGLRNHAHPRPSPYLPAQDDHRGRFLAKSRRKDGKVSRATVYRTLSFLVRAGLLRQVGIGQSTPMYDPNFADHPRHGHFVCVDCQKIVEFHDHCLDVRESIVTKDHGFSPKRVNLQIEATCDALRDKGVCPRNSRPIKPASKK